MAPLTREHIASIQKAIPELEDFLKSHIELYGMAAINFRTTFATMMVASEVDIKTTQALMGHSTPDMTLKVYAKKEESRLPDAVREMESFLAGSAAFCTKKRAAACATLWCGKQDLNLHES